MKNPVLNETYNNDWYKQEIGASGFKQLMWYFVNVIFFINPLNPSAIIKRFFLRSFGAKIGAGVVLKPAINIKYPWKLSIGDHSWIGEKVWIDNLANVDIGRNVCLSQGAVLLTGNHDFSKAGFDLMVKPILIEDGVWIGASAVVCPGVLCASHAVLTAGSVAVQKMEAFSIYQGNPAVFVKERNID
jgi:putative colanic acid biosynthesis acetyltransferase WcaF